LLANMDLLLTVRYHGLDLWCIAGVPAVSIAYDPNVEHLSSQLGIRSFAPYEVEAEDLAQALISAWENRKEIAWEMRLFAKQARRLVLEDTERVIRVAKRHLGGLV